MGVIAVSADYQCCGSGFNGSLDPDPGLAKMTHKNRKKLINFIFWIAGFSEGFPCSLDVLYRGLGISKLHFWNIKKYIYIIFSVFFFFKFWSWIRIRIHLKCWIHNTAYYCPDNIYNTCIFISQKYTFTEVSLLQLPTPSCYFPCVFIFLVYTIFKFSYSSQLSVSTLSDGLQTYRSPVSRHTFTYSRNSVTVS